MMGVSRFVLFEHDPAWLPKIPQHVDAMIECQVRRDGPAFRLEHHRCLRRGDLPQQLELLVSQRAPGRIVAELEALPMDLADPVRQLKPRVAWKGVRLEGRGMSIEDRRPLLWDPGVLPSAALSQ
jgi:hypothetical protein